MLEIVIAIASIPVVAIAGWAIVESSRAFARGRTDPRLEQRLESLSSAIVELRAELDEVASKQDADRHLLEERLDFAERLLTRARGESGSR